MVSGWVRQALGAAAGVGMAARGAAGACRRLGRAAVLSALLAAAGLAPAAAADRVDVNAWEDQGFGRIVLSFVGRDLLPQYSFSTANGVLAITFAEPVIADVSRVSTTLSAYVPVARLDPDGEGIRFALGRGVKVNRLEAGERLFIDLLPPNWRGLPPGLPPEVVADLAKRAEAAIRRARELELANPRRIEPKLEIRTGRNPTFSRFVFNWNVPFDTEFSRQNEAVSITFNKQAEVDVELLRTELPPYVDDIRAFETADGQMKVILDVPPAADVRGFREDMSYVVDVQPPLRADGTPAPVETVRKALGGPAGPVGAVTLPGAARPEALLAAVTSPEPPAAAAPDAPATTPEAPAAAPAPEAPVAPAPSTGPSATASPPADTPPAATAPGTTTASVPLPRPSPQRVLPAPPAEEVAAAPAATPAEPAAAPDVATAEAASAPPAAPAADMPRGPLPMPAGSVELGPQPVHDRRIQVQAQRIGTTHRLVFAFPEPVGAAMFTRAGAIWLVFDDDRPIEVGPIQEGLASVARRIETLQPDGRRALRIEMADPLLATLDADGTFWVVTIGERVMQPTRPLPLLRSVRPDGAVAIDVPFGSFDRIIPVTDPSVGDRIVVVTGRGQPRGLIKDQSFVEVDALTSAFGLAFVPKADDVTVTGTATGVAVERPGGLSISVAVPQGQQAGAAGLLGTAMPAGESLPDLNELTAAPADYALRRHKLEGAINAAENDADRANAWRRLAAFYIANRMGSEAEGALGVVAALAPADVNRPQHRLMVGAAKVLSGRPREALPLLSAESLRDSPEAAVWRVIAMSHAGDFPGARRHISRAETVAGAMPPALAGMFLTAAARAALEQSDFGNAISLLREIDRRGLEPNAIAEVDLLNGRIAEASARTADAIGLYSRIVLERKGPVAIEAAYRLVRLQHREGVLTLDQAVDRLEGLAVAWRGDELELKVLRLLAQLTVEKGDYRRAFEVLHAATSVDAASDTTRLLHEEMSAAFASLFLDGRADAMEPLDALSLYYDFRDLTPVGRRGDEMVRKLANRLVDLDLLPQAAELLDHQVQNRLKGAARAQVAADLALVHLIDHRPDKALVALGRTRQAQLPAAIERQRRLIEARALAASGKPDLALEILGTLTGPDADRLTAETLWAGARHREAGESYERLLGARFDDPTPLDATEQNEVMRAAISLALAGDRLGVDRLREKFGRAMADSPSASSFAVVTGPVDTSGTEFRAIAASIASVDTMRAFLADYRAKYVDAGAGRPSVVQPPEAPPAPADVAPPAEPVPQAAAPGGDASDAAPAA